VSFQYGCISANRRFAHNAGTILHCKYPKKRINISKNRVKPLPHKAWGKQETQIVPLLAAGIGLALKLINMYTS